MISKVVGNEVKAFANLGGGGGGDTPEPVVPVPDGKTVTPVNNVSILVACAGLPNATSYVVISQILDDPTTILSIISSENAVDYLSRSVSFSDDICSDEAAMTAIGLNNYCSNSLIGNSDWADALSASEYSEKVFNLKIPVMQTDTTPDTVGRVIYDSPANQSAYPVKNAFDGDVNTRAFVYSTGYLGYELNNASYVSYITLVPSCWTGNHYSSTRNIEISTDGTNWSKIGQYTFTNKYTDGPDVIIYNDVEYEVYNRTGGHHWTGTVVPIQIKAEVKAVRISGVDSQTPIGMAELQFYGREDV